MEFLPALSAWQWVLVIAIPPAIVALYFLKLRRQPLEVPSTYLWHKSLEDLHVNSLWQRIRQSLLLYLQLLLVLLVIFALLRPGLHSNKLVDQRNILLIDNSASMAASDVAPTRLIEAKRRALAVIDNLQSADEREEIQHQSGEHSSSSLDNAGSYQAMIVSFSDTGRVEQGWTNNVRDLRQAIENIQPTNRPTNISEALKVATGLANPARAADDAENKSTVPPAKLFIFSDGKFPPVKDISLGDIEPVFVPIGRANASNLGIVSFSVRRNEERENQLQAFGSIENFGPETVTAPIDLLLEGRLIDASQLTIKPGDTSGVSFNLGDADTGILELRISRDDALTADNHAWAAINGSRRPKVLLVTPGNPALELAVSTPRAGELADVSTAPPSILLTKEHQAAAAAGEFDLIIYDRCRPQKMPHANTLFIGEAPPPPTEDGVQVAAPAKPAKGPQFKRVAASSNENSPVKSNDAKAKLAGAAADVDSKPSEKWWSLGDLVVSPQIIDVDRTHPLTQWLDLGDVDFAQARPVTPPPGGTRLIDSNKGTLFAIAPREGFEDAVLGFDIYSTDATGGSEPNTNWPIRRSFPAFVFAVLSYLGGGATQAGENIKPGQPLTIRTDVPTEHLTIVTPSGEKRPAVRGKNGSFAFSQTDQLGPYQVLDGAKTIQRFTVNLLDELESDIPSALENPLKIGDTVVQPSPALQPVRRETWRWLLVAALAVLLLEWYIYNRRIYV